MHSVRQKRTYEKKLEVAKEAVAEKQKLETEIPELEQMQKKLQEEEQERKNQLLVSERDKANVEEQAVKVRGKLEFPEKAEAEQQIKELEKRKKEMDTESGYCPESVSGMQPDGGSSEDEEENAGEADRRQ